MKMWKLSVGLVICLHPSAWAGGPGVTLYNQGFALVRETVPLDLQAGINEVRFAGATAHVEPDSVILRDPAGKRRIQILEQNYRGDVVSSNLLLAMYEGKSLEFLVERQGLPPEIVKAVLIRAPYVIHPEGIRRYGQQYLQGQMAMGGGYGTPSTPIVEINGQVRFGLPGTPLFPPLKNDEILRPTFHWILHSDSAGKLDAELAYLTGGMSWEADYNVVAAADSDEMSMVGWITADNQSGKTFTNATISLMAGDVHKLRRDPGGGGQSVFQGADRGDGPAVEAQAFDEYHLYKLPRTTTLRDRETKQVEFIRAAGIQAKRLYVYDGFMVHWNIVKGLYREDHRDSPEYGTKSNSKVWVMKEFANTADNNLGIPLPRGRFRFYRDSGEGTLEFTGENFIDHTPEGELVRVHTGNAFDLVGERRRTDFSRNDNRQRIDESFEIKLRNHKDQPVPIRVVEHLYRWHSWEITAKSHPFEKKDSQTIEFQILVPPADEITITYSVRYEW